MRRSVCGWYPETVVYLPLARIPRCLSGHDDRHRGAVFWVGALCWNIASKNCQHVILGPLIVLRRWRDCSYTFILRRKSPFLTLSGIALTVAGVVIAVSRRKKRPSFRSRNAISLAKIIRTPKGYSLALKRCILNTTYIIANEVTALWLIAGSTTGELALSIPRASALAAVR